MPASAVVQPPAGTPFTQFCKPRLVATNSSLSHGGCRKRDGSIGLSSLWAAPGRPFQKAASLQARQAVQAMAVALQEQEQHLAPSVHPSEAWSWNDSSSLEMASRQQLHRILSQLLADGELSTKQVAVASDLAADLQLVQLAPDLLAAALLVVLARAEGRNMPLSAACRAVHGACGSGRYSDMLCALVRQLEGTWKASVRWQQLLGPAVSSHSLAVQQVQLLLQQLATGGPPEVAACVPIAAEAVTAVVPDREAPGNLAGGLLVLASRSLEAQGQRQLSCSAVARAIQAAGGEASVTGLGSAARRLGPVFHTLGLASPRTVGDPVALRHEQLKRLYTSLSAQGELPPADVPLLLSLAAAMPKTSWPAGATAAALMVMLGRARGTALSQGAAVAAVQRAGGQIRSGISFHVKLLTRHWQASSEWQSLLGPAKDAPTLARERLVALLQRLSDQGALKPKCLVMALGMAASMPPAVLGQPHLVGGLAGALLVLLAASHGERLAKKRAEALIHAAGGEASASGITHNLDRLQEHWQTSESWRAAFGAPPDAGAWDSRPAPLQQILLRLQEAGHIQPALAPAIDHLAGRLLLRPTAHGNFVAAVLVAAAQAARLQHAVHPGTPPKQQRRQLTIRQAVAAVKAAGGSASLGRTGAMLRRLLASWQAGGAGHGAVLGPYEVPGGSDSQPQLEQTLRELCFAGVVPPSRLATALQLAGGLTVKARRAWQAGNMAAALLVVLAAAEGRRLLPAEAAEAVRRGIGAEPEAAIVHRHRVSAFKLWQSSKEWQALLGPSPLSPPPSRTTVSGLLRGLASQGVLPFSQLQPALALARSLRVQQEQAGAVAGALAVGWARSSGRAGSVEGVVLALRAAGGAAGAPQVEQQLRGLEERWGPPTAWAAALRHPRAAAHQQCWHVLAMLLVKLEVSGHLPSGKACKALHLAQTLQVWTGRGPSQRPGNVAGALLLVFARAAGGPSALTCGQAVAAVRGAGEAAFESSVTKWHARCMQQWRASTDWQDTLGQPPPAEGI